MNKLIKNCTIRNSNKASGCTTGSYYNRSLIYTWWSYRWRILYDVDSLRVGLVGKRGTATLIALVQALLIIVTGVYCTNGILSIVTYTLPGFMVVLTLVVIRSKGNSLLGCFLGGVAVNIGVTFLSNIDFLDYLLFR